MNSSPQFRAAIEATNKENFSSDWRTINIIRPSDDANRSKTDWIVYQDDAVLQAPMVGWKLFVAPSRVKNLIEFAATAHQRGRMLEVHEAYRMLCDYNESCLVPTFRSPDSESNEITGKR